MRAHSIFLTVLAVAASVAGAQPEDPNLARPPMFYESFDGCNSVEANGGVGTGACTFVKGVRYQAGDFRNDFSKWRRVHYPTAGNVDLAQGTIELWVKAPADNGYGLFDIGGLGASNSWGIYKNVNYLIMEVKNKSNYFTQAWSPTEFPPDGDWHHVAGVWQNVQGTTYFKVCLDGKSKPEYDGKTVDSYPDPCGVFTVGWCGWYGYSESIIDELRIYDYAMTGEQIKEMRQRTIDENSPYFTEALPNERVLVVDPCTVVTFQVEVKDPLDDPIDVQWLVNDKPAGQGNTFAHEPPKGSVAAVRAVATDGAFSIEKDWGLYVRPPVWKIFDGQFMVDGKPFLVKGVCYTPWLPGTGPDPKKKHAPLPDENDDVTGRITHLNKVSVPDYSGDGKIQMWEVVQFDLETIKRVGANTIRTYAAGYWHDKNLNGVLDRSSMPENDEIVQGDLPDWVLDKIVSFCEINGMKLILGYWVQEEDYRDVSQAAAGFQLECDWKDLEVAKSTLGRVVQKYGRSPAILAWGIGNEVHGEWNQFFTWKVDINAYLNALFQYVQSADPQSRPVMYAKYIGENATFRSLTAEIIGVNAYIHSAEELIDLDEFSIRVPAGKAYLLAEYGHLTDQAQGQWDLACQFAGGSFLEYCDVWWKLADQRLLGLVSQYREVKPDRYEMVRRLYSGTTESEARP